MQKYVRNKEQAKKYNKEYNKKLKLDIIKNYGGKCICCSEDIVEFLTIDHINNDGALDKKRGLYRSTLYNWLKNNNYPKDRFQLMCMNCNFAKGRFGVCPHSINKEIN